MRIHTCTIDKRHLKFLIILLITIFLIFIVNFPVYSSVNSKCQSLNRCVFLGDRPLFEIKAKAGDYIPEVRAYIISNKLTSKAKDMSINIDWLHATKLNDNTAAVAISANNIQEEYLLTITEKDAELEAPLELARKYNKIIQEEITNYRSRIRGNPWWSLFLLVFSFIVLVHQLLWNWIIFLWNWFRNLPIWPWNWKWFWNWPIWPWNWKWENWKWNWKWFWNWPIWPWNWKWENWPWNWIKNLWNLPIWPWNNPSNTNPNNSSNPLIKRLKTFTKTLTKTFTGNQDKNGKLTPDHLEKQYQKWKRDPSGNLIEEIYSLEPDYVIYRTGNRIICFINEDHIENPDRKKLHKNYNKVQKELAKIRSKLPPQIEEIEAINILIAKGIRLALDGEKNTAKEVLNIADQRLDKFRNKYNARTYLSGSFLGLISFLIAIPSLVIFPILWPDSFKDFFLLLGIPREFLVVIIFGGLGGFLSVAYRMGTGGLSKEKDPDSNFRILGAARIYIAVISSLVIYSAFKGEIVNGVSLLLKDNLGETVGAKIAFISALAGFVERFVPDLLTRSAQQNEENSNKIKDDNGT